MIPDSPHVLVWSNDEEFRNYISRTANHKQKNKNGERTMKHINVVITGISPLLMHKFPLVPVEALEKKSPEEQAELCAYRDQEGQLCVPGVNVQRALVSAATFSKGKGRASLQKEAAACVMVEESTLSLGISQFVVDSRPVVIAATKGRVLRHRPRLDKWGVAFTLSFDETLITETQVRKIVDDCGSRVGLLDFRPERKGPFGRFMVTTWKTGKN
jgi:hypothetical protein